jgi:hypothetical protein
MTKQTDKKAKELSKGRDEKPQEEEEEQSADGDEAEDEEQEEGDESDADESDADESDEDESDEDESEETEEEDDKAASAKPAGKSRRAAPVEDDEAEEEEEEDAEDEDEQDEDDEEAEAPAEPEDPYWWTPHAVLGGLVLIGVLGFFGVFNKAFGFLAKRGPAPSETPAAVAAPPKPSPSARPFQPPGQQPQAPAEMFGAKHLLVMYKGGRRAPANVTRTKEEAKARAEEALKKIKVNKVKFEDVVAEYSDEPGAAQRGGDLREFPKGSMVPEFQTGLVKIKVGEVSDLVETPFGYHVILRTK